MARTPSMTADECEAIIGRRGFVAIDSANRGTVQKWLTARGVNATAAKACTLAVLGAAYNDPSDRYLLETFAEDFRGVVRNDDKQGEPDMQPRTVTVSVKECDACKAPIGWLRSRRTRRFYPVNADRETGNRTTQRLPPLRDGWTGDTRRGGRGGR